MTIGVNQMPIYCHFPGAIFGCNYRCTSSNKTRSKPTTTCVVKLVRVKPDLMAQSTETLISLGSPWEEEEDSSNEKVVVPVGNNILLSWKHLMSTIINILIRVLTVKDMTTIKKWFTSIVCPTVHQIQSLDRAIYILKYPGLRDKVLYLLSNHCYCSITVAR